VNDPIASISTGAAAIATAWAAVIAARRAGQHDCEDRLKEARAEAEKEADELHRLRMRESGAVRLYVVLAAVSTGLVVAAVVFAVLAGRSSSPPSRAAAATETTVPSSTSSTPASPSVPTTTAETTTTTVPRAPVTPSETSGGTNIPATSGTAPRANQAPVTSPPLIVPARALVPTTVPPARAGTSSTTTTVPPVTVPTTTTTTTVPSSPPTTAVHCSHGGFKDAGFRNHGQCVSKTHAR
jgi:cytoskeletal protein RodZ